MVKVGDVLLQPESGWIRIDDTNTNIKFTGISGEYLGKFTDYNSYNKTYTQFKNGKCTFKFKGDKLRIIGLNSTVSDYSKNACVVIDGIEIGSFSNFERSIKFQCLLFEVKNLECKEHTCEIYSKDNKIINIDAIDVDENFKLGEQLLKPDVGWKRYDDNYQYIEYTNMERTFQSYAYNNYYHNHKDENGGCIVKFNFVSNKIRIIGVLFDKCGIDNIEVILNGNSIGKFGQYNYATKYQIVNYEINNLPYEEHCIELKQLDKKQFYIDAIDIDENGELKLYNKNLFKYLLKQENEYYTVKDSYYDIKSRRYVPCEKKFETHGFNCLNLLLKKYNYIDKNKENIIPILNKNENDFVKLTVNNKNENDEPYKVFDRNNDYNNRSFWYSKTGCPYWFSIEFKQDKKCVYGYSFTTSNNYIPNFWTLKGSNDGINWNVVDTQKNQSNVLKYNNNHVYICNGHLDYYSIYKYDFSETSDNNILIIEMEIYDTDTLEKPFAPINKFSKNKKLEIFKYKKMKVI